MLLPTSSGLGCKYSLHTKLSDNVSCLSNQALFTTTFLSTVHLENRCAMSSMANYPPSHPHSQIMKAELEHFSELTWTGNSGEMSDGQLSDAVEEK